MQHTVIVVMHDRPHALNRAIALFRREAFRIDSLAVASTEQPGLVRMTVVLPRDQVKALITQLKTLPDIVSVRDVTHQRMVAHELCLVRLSSPGDRLVELLRLARACDARVIEAAPHAIVLALMGAPPDITRALEQLQAFGVVEFTRSSRIAMPMPSHTATGAAPAAPYTWQADGM